MNWNDVFGLNVSPAELIVRGTAMYLLVIIADAAQNGMSGEYRSFTEGAILVTTIVAWNVLTDWLTYKSSRLQKILEPPPLLLIDNGRLLRRNLRVEFVSEDELRSKLREHGVTDYAQVAKAYMESDGEISVIKRQKNSSGAKNRGLTPVS